MQVTRDVVTDLWGVYESGEASADTRALVEAFLSQDAELARALRAPAALTAPRVPDLPPDHGRQALALTQKLLRRRQWLLGLALFFSFLPGWTVHTSTLRWTMWRDLPMVAMAAVVVAAGLWVAYALAARRLRVKGF